MTLNTRVAIVAGASCGAGRGIALALGECGATVYATGRTTRTGKPPSDGAPGTIDDTAEEVTARGGVGIAVQVDHTDREQVAALFERVDKEQSRLDLLVNAVWGGNEIHPQLGWSKPFWEQPDEGWQLMMQAGVYAYLLNSQWAARLMAGPGLIVHVSEGGGDYGGQIHWDLAHEAINRMAVGMSADGKQKNIAVVVLNPGFMRTERVLMHLKTEAQKKMFGFDRSESTEYIGRAVTSLAGDAAVMAKTGQILYVADLAQEYGFTDIDGKFVPRFDPRPSE
ncbi:MAG: SDR family NAD(P)-dependent oxidoreductase [Acidobacteria bacterium]|nr:SDR family NAD(P)-dependent oxidoreductase [Acidobacteriota bacterium]MDA1235159.1 SDR family NAD(P)-dependent oxidoreductase [Acidobacteriota bacterium]